MTDILEQIIKLRTEGEPFVIATVVAYKHPQSAKPGSKAIIRADGTITGWIGGGCVQPIVLREAKKVLEEKKPGLVIITPEHPPNDWQGVRDYMMACQGGGSLQIYLEPVLPRPELCIFGQSPVAQTLAEFAKMLEFQVSMNPDEIKPGSYVVVATMGDGDEEALTKVCGSDAAYKAFVASKEKSASLFQYLREKGIPEERIKKIKSPAGLPLGAETLPEIAFSVMAEIVQIRRAASVTRPHDIPADQAKLISVLQSRPEAIDPICKMTVDIATAKYTAAYQAQTYYFCCLRCKETFERSPAQYA